MPKNDDAVANPPKGGDQSQASTNDDNVNDTLTSAPWVVAESDGTNHGVRGRFADKADAENLAAALRLDRPKRIEVTVLKENDIKDGLPAFVAEQEAAHASLDETPRDTAADTTTTGK